jgi:DNA-binding IclR family transcriptional regulator
MLEHELTKLRDALLQLHAEAREIGEHQVAYHALAGALHAAESLREVDMLEEVGALAREHGRWIDQNEPTHPLSSHSAALRGHQSIFEQLAAMCAAVRARLKAENLTRK